MTTHGLVQRTIDSDMEDHLSDDRPSKRAMFKDATSRTKNRFKRSEAGYNTNEEIDDFLATGKATAPIDKLTMLPSPTAVLLSKPHSLVHPVPPGRRASAPRLSITQISRYPNAQPHSAHPQPQNEHLLQTPEQTGRCQSLSSLKGQGRRPRDLCVGFVNTPPVIIGEGGDQAEAPPIQVSRARKMARSPSPVAGRMQYSRSAEQGQQQSTTHSPVRRKPVPSPSPPRNPSPSFEAKPSIVLRSTARSVADIELDRALRINKSTLSVPTNDQFHTEISAPKPIRPMRTPPLTSIKSRRDIDPFIADDADAVLGAVEVVIANQKSSQTLQPEHPMHPTTNTSGHRGRDPTNRASRDPTYDYYHQR